MDSGTKHRCSVFQTPEKIVVWLHETRFRRLCTRISFVAAAEIYLEARCLLIPSKWPEMDECPSLDNRSSERGSEGWECPAKVLGSTKHGKQHGKPQLRSPEWGDKHHCGSLHLVFVRTLEIKHHGG